MSIVKKTVNIVIFIIGCLGAIAAFAGLPTVAQIESRLEIAKQADQSNADNKIVVQDWETALDLLAKIQEQQEANNVLQTNSDNAEKLTAESRRNLEKYRSAHIPTEQELMSLSLESLQQRAQQIELQLQPLQGKLSSLNAELVSSTSVPERVQTALSSNATRVNQINQALSNEVMTPSRQQRLNIELSLLALQSSYHQNQLQNNDILTALIRLQIDENTALQQNLQSEQRALQAAVNEKHLQASRERVEQATAQEQDNVNTNPLIAKELGLNTKISQYLLDTTTTLNALTQDNLRVRSVLDNLQQTQRNIDEQISALQGSLVLSRIINKQRQSLPQDQMLSGLAKQIADLRVRIFDITELRDKLYDIPQYIANVERNEKMTLSDSDRAQLDTLLQERRRITTELLKQLNNQLNLSINIELNQKQVQAISDELQNKLQQQSFWVESNAPINLAWFQNFLPLLTLQIKEISAKLDFSHWNENLLSAGLLIAVLLIVMVAILRQRERIKAKLNAINSQIKIGATDNHWHTPQAMFWTLVLCLPSTLQFFAFVVLVSSIAFQDPMTLWSWGLEMAGYWLYFAFFVAILRPNGIAYRHFNMPQESAVYFRQILKNSVWAVVLLLNTSIFTNLDRGIAYDVIGEVMTIFILIVTIFMIAPAFRKASHTITDSVSATRFVLALMRIILLLAPFILIGLIALGYYHTSLVLIEHFISSYFAFTTWLILRSLIYRSFEVSAQRLAYRRLESLREQTSQEQVSQNDESAVKLPTENSLAISQIKDQVLRMVDFVLWIGLVVMLYLVWSDLITVAYYLDGVTLWSQNVTTEQGVTSEAVTLLNLLIAVLILIVTYVLVKNLGGLLEVLVFSHVKLSQGTPYTVTTLLTYFAVAFGAAVAFSTLGMSWSKLQWLFAALSVGLGFGMQEIFANFISGIIILFERPVRIGDTITIGDFSGTVSKIRIRATTIIDFDKKEVIVPNKAFVTERLINWALSDSMTRIIINVGVAYGSDLEKVRQLLLQAANENERVLKDPEPVAYFMAFGASTLDHELRVYVDKIIDRTRAQDELNRRINELFAENGIEIAFNQLDVFIKNQSTNEEVLVSSEKLGNYAAK